MCIRDRGVSLEKNYPYKGLTRQECKKQVAGDRIHAKDYVTVPAQNPEQLKAALEKGPVAVAVQGHSLVFMQYSGGIISDSSCGTDTNHAALAVGYGFENGMEYYLVKNSWGTQWGDNGYVKIAITEGSGICGINNHPVTVEMGPSDRQNEIPEDSLDDDEDNIYTRNGHYSYSLTTHFL